MTREPARDAHKVLYLVPGAGVDGGRLAGQSRSKAPGEPLGDLQAVDAGQRSGDWQHPTGHGQPAQPLAIAILRRHGWRKIAAALRRNARDATRVLPLLGITSP